MSIVIGILALPFLIWSWLRGGNEEDGLLTISLVSWLVVLGSGTLLARWALS
jgi:hypothetical protein